MKLDFNYKGKKIGVDARRCGLFGMFRGLMFRRREKAPALLLFDFEKQKRLKIHSFFVFFPFAAVWLDRKNKVIEIKKVESWKAFIIPKKSFYKLIEIPVNEKYKMIIRELGLKK